MRHRFVMVEGARLVLGRSRSLLGGEARVHRANAMKNYYTLQWPAPSVAAAHLTAGDKIGKIKKMKITRLIVLFAVSLGLSLGAMTATVTATKQAFAEPCPMEQSSKKADCPCCDDHCDGAMMSCNAKCGACSAAMMAHYSLLPTLGSGPGTPFSHLLREQVRYGPAPPIPIV